MSKINVSVLVKQMLTAAQGVLAKKWPEAKDYAESEYKKIGEAILFIEKQTVLGAMSKEKAKLHLEIQKNASRAVLLTLEGLGILTAEAAINAALGAIKDTVNTALGFKLI